MARVKGRDVVLELMDAVERLEATSAEHADLLESLAEHTVSTSAEVAALAGQMAHVSRQMNDVSQRMNDVSQRMDDVSQRMDDVSQRVDDVSQRMEGVSQGLAGVSKRTASLEVDFHTLAQNSVESAKLARTVQQHLGRLAKLLGEYAGGSKSRFETIEDRLDRLEKKTG
jgi:chromosome segregation ATPase